MVSVSQSSRGVFGRWVKDIRVSRLSVDTGGSFSLAIAHTANIKDLQTGSSLWSSDDDRKFGCQVRGGWARVGLLVGISGVIIYIGLV